MERLTGAHDLRELLAAERQQRPLDLFARAVAAIGDRRGLKDLDLERAEHRPEHVLGAESAVEHRGHVSGGVNAGLDQIDGLVRCAGEKLHDVAACGADTLIGLHEHAEGAGGRDLLTLGKILCDVLGDLAGDELHAADIRLLHPKVADDGQHSVRSDGGADVQLAAVFFKQADLRVFDPAADVALGVGDRQQRPERAAALDLKRDGAVLHLLHISHHGRGSKQPPQRGRCRGERFVHPARGLGDLARGNGDGLHKAVLGHGTNNMILHSMRNS